MRLSSEMHCMPRLSAWNVVMLDAAIGIRVLNLMSVPFALQGCTVDLDSAVAPSHVAVHHPATASLSPSLPCR